MRNGWLIVNGFLTGEKFTEIYDMLIEAGKKYDCNLRVLTNDQVLSILPISDDSVEWRSIPDFVIFWDKDVRLAMALEAEGFRLFNSADAIMDCDDKARTFLKLKNKGFKMPKTYAAPLNFNQPYQEFAFLMQIEKNLGYPFIIKENCGSFGRQVYMVSDWNKAVKTINKIGHNDFIMQEFVEHSSGMDVRLQVVGDKVVTAMKRTNDNDFIANVTNGGKMEKYDPSKEEIDLALRVAKELKLDFAGVDVLFSPDGPVLCEVNSNAHFKNIYDCTGVNVAEDIIKHIINSI